MESWRGEGSELLPNIAIPLMHFSSEYVISNYLTHRNTFLLFLLINWHN